MLDNSSTHGTAEVKEVARRRALSEQVALREHIDAYITHWNDDPTPFIWTKPAASIIRSRKRMLDRISHAVHTAPLAKTLMWEHVGSEAGRSS